jgi:hypothetical protein
MEPMPTLQLQTIVEQELYRMLARQLDYAPTADELPFTAKVMTDDLVYRGLRDQDCDRVREAFQKLGPALQRWPTARMVIEAMPPEQPDRALPRPDPNMEKVAAGIAGMRRAKKERLRSVFLPGESYNDYKTALDTSHKSKEEFDAERLRMNGF